MPQLVPAIPQQSTPADAGAQVANRPARLGKHAHPINTVTAPGAGQLAGFALMLRCPVPVACGWTAVASGHGHQQPTSGLAPAYTQLRTELAEPPAVLAARLEAVADCLTMAELPISDQLSVVRTTSDGWALIEAGNVRLASVVVEMSGVSAPVAIAMLTRLPARHGSLPGTAPRRAHGREPAQVAGP